MAECLFVACDAFFMHAFVFFLFIPKYLNHPHVFFLHIFKIFTWSLVTNVTFNFFKLIFPSC